MDKVGRNNPCPCGKLKADGVPFKYKKCCMNKNTRPSQEEIKEIMAIMGEKVRKQEEEKGELEKMGIFINYVKPIPFQGGKVWALGNKVYAHRPPHETFHDFIVFILLETLDIKWVIEERQKAEKHFIVQCLEKYDMWKAKHISDSHNQMSKNEWYAMPDGWTRSLASLAFDICSLRHTQQLPTTLIQRLKLKDSYQGARYEIAIAAIFARLGCKIDFLDTGARTGDKHCEFYATHERSGISVAVEAKSRHREGVIHSKGQMKEEEKLLKGDVQRLFAKALEQNPNDRAFMVFIDINSPLTPNVEVQDKPWFKDIEEGMGRHGTPTPEKPDLFNAAFFTNYSFHYQTDNEASKGEHLAIIPHYTKFSMPDVRFIKMLVTALNNYGNVPLIKE